MGIRVVFHVVCHALLLKRQRPGLKRKAAGHAGADVEEQPDRASASALALRGARRRARDGWGTTGPGDTRIDCGRGRGVLPQPRQIGLAVRSFGRRSRKIDLARPGPRHALGLVGRPLRLDHDGRSSTARSRMQKTASAHSFAVPSSFELPCSEDLCSTRHGSSSSACHRFVGIGEPIRVHRLARVAESTYCRCLDGSLAISWATNSRSCDADAALPN